MNKFHIKDAIFTLRKDFLGNDGHDELTKNHGWDSQDHYNCFSDAGPNKMNIL